MMRTLLLVGAAGLIALLSDGARAQDAGAFAADATVLAPAPVVERRILAIDPDRAIDRAADRAVPGRRYEESELARLCGLPGGGGAPAALCDLYRQHAGRGAVRGDSSGAAYAGNYGAAYASTYASNAALAANGYATGAMVPVLVDGPGYVVEETETFYETVPVAAARRARVATRATPRRYAARPAVRRAIARPASRCGCR